MVDDAQLMKFFVQLTRRQQEVLALASLGMTNAQIGKQLCIQSSVVAGHLTKIYGALDNLMEQPGAPNRYVLVRLFASFFERYQALRPE